MAHALITAVVDWARDRLDARAELLLTAVVEPGRGLRQCQFGVASSFPIPHLIELWSVEQERRTLFYKLTVQPQSIFSEYYHRESEVK